MLKRFCLLAMLMVTSNPSMGADSPAAEVVPVRDCLAPEARRPCAGRDAVFFVHGIYGDIDTFNNGSYRWPQELAADFPDIDVFIIKYRTRLLNWLLSDVATFDEIAEALMGALQGPLVADQTRRLVDDGLLTKRRYRSVGFIAHSLGGNVTAAYLHSVKSELGHNARAQHAYIITLGTPVHGSSLANVAVMAKEAFGLQRDDLLQSLQKDNLFLRMLYLWRRAEDWKALRFECRRVNLYAGIERRSMLGLMIVPLEDAKLGYDTQKIMPFDTYDHRRIAAPDKKTDPLNLWVSKIIKEERLRMDDWRKPLCNRIG